MHHHCGWIPDVQIQQEFSVSSRDDGGDTSANTGKQIPIEFFHSRLAYQLYKRFHPNIELVDRFFITQLYEYEPILQVQRTQSGGNSCSRELRSALLKRKKTYDDCGGYHTDGHLPPTLICSADVLVSNIEQTTDILME